MKKILILILALALILTLAACEDKTDEKDDDTTTDNSTDTDDINITDSGPIVVNNIEIAADLSNSTEDGLSSTENWVSFGQGTVILNQSIVPGKSGAKYIRIKTHDAQPCDVIFQLIFNDINDISGILKTELEFVNTAAPYSVGSLPDWDSAAEINITGNNGVFSFNSIDIYPNGISAGDEIVMRLDYYISPSAGDGYKGKNINVSFNIIAVQYNTKTVGVNDNENPKNITKTVGSLNDLEDALIALPGNPGMTWIFTNDIILTDEWAAAHGQEWTEAVKSSSGSYPGGFVESVLMGAERENMIAGLTEGGMTESEAEEFVDSLGSSAVMFIEYPVNIDLNGFTWDLSVLKATGGFADDPSSSPQCLYFVPASAVIPCSMDITNGTIIADYIYYQLIDGNLNPVPVIVSMTDTFRTNAEIRVWESGVFRPHNPGADEKIRDNHLPLE